MSFPTTPGRDAFFSITSVAPFVDTHVPFALVMQLSGWAITSWHSAGKTHQVKDLPDSV